MNSTINNVNTGAGNMIKSLNNLVPPVKTEETPRADLGKQRDDLSAVARQGLDSIKAAVPEIKTEQAPEINYRTATKQEAVEHIVYEVAAHAGLGGTATAGVQVLRDLINKHEINWNQVKKEAVLGGFGGTALVLMQDAFDTITNRGGSNQSSSPRRDRHN